MVLVQAQNVEKDKAEGCRIRAMSASGSVLWTVHLFEGVVLMAANE